jgi:hypothetical protein
MDIAWDLFDKERAVQGEGEILATEEVTEWHVEKSLSG